MIPIATDHSVSALRDQLQEALGDRYSIGCALMPDAQLAVTQRRAHSHALVDSLDAFLRSSAQGPILAMGNRVAAGGE